MRKFENEPDLLMGTALFTSDLPPAQLAWAIREELQTQIREGKSEKAPPSTDLAYMLDRIAESIRVTRHLLSPGDRVTPPQMN